MKEEYDWGNKLKYEPYDGDGTEKYNVNITPPEFMQNAYLYRPLRTTTGKPTSGALGSSLASAPEPSALILTLVAS